MLWLLFIALAVVGVWNLAVGLWIVSAALWVLAALVLWCAIEKSAYDW